MLIGLALALVCGSIIFPASCHGLIVCGIHVSSGGASSNRWGEWVL